MTESDGQQGAPSQDESSSKVVDLSRMNVRACLDRYWRTNVIVTVGLLAIWAIAGLGCGIVFADRLNKINLPGTGFPLGFWFAHQGSIIIFVLLILAYCIFMNKLDARHHEQLMKLKEEEGGQQ